MRALLVCAAMMSIATQANAQQVGEVTPLFAESTPLEVEISGPIRTIARQAERSMDPHPGSIRINGETHAIELSARGISRRRRDVCRFPPLRVTIEGNPAETSLLDRQGSIKLVTHCNSSDRFEQQLLREYAAYRLYNVVTPQSFRVRLLRVTYREDGQEPLQKWGFFIEDVDDAARRLDGREIEVLRIPPSALDARSTARYALFQYMIGNTDWAVTAGPSGSECCHNTKLIGATDEARTGLIPLPYDFDSTGLVDPPYAAPSEMLSIRSVTQRLFRGFCAHRQMIIEEAAEFRAARPRMEAELAAIPGMADGTRSDIQRYLGRFFEDIETPTAVARNLLSDCR